MKLTLTNMQKSLDSMISDAHHFDLRHTDNTCARIPALVKKGLENQLQKTLPSQPPQIIIHPRTPANSVQSEPLPTPAPAPKPKKGKCPDCHLPYHYDHVAWCRGQVNGWTCCCKSRLPTPFPTKPSPTTGSNTIPIWPPLATIYAKKCHACNSPHHIKVICPKYHCCYCHHTTPGHLNKDCTIKKLRDQKCNQPPFIPDPAFSMASTTSMEMKMAISMENANSDHTDSLFHEAEPHLFLISLPLTHLPSI